MNVKVSIPVHIGGYTGQRDSWEAINRDYEVRIDADGVVALQSDTDTQRIIKFSLAELNEAIRFLQERDQ